jgi:uncharacterized cupredoxin-like copper-binding protein
LKKSLVVLITLVLGGALLLGAACGGDDDEEAAAPAATETAAPSGDEADVEAAARAVAEAYNSGDVEAFLATVSDDFVTNVFSAFGVSTKDDARRDAASGDFTVGDPPFEDFQISNVKVSGGSATMDESHREGRTLVSEELSLIKGGESWLLDDIKPLKVEAPEGATQTELGLVDFAFNLTTLSFPAGDVTFQATNNGQQPHEFFIAKLPEGVSLQQALEADDLAALGVEDIGGFQPIDPGEQATWTFLDLEPGRYGYVCFVPDANDPEGTPHAFKGMVGEFTVQ